MASSPSPAITPKQKTFPVKTTQRAYTLRLRPAITKQESPNEVRRKAKEMQDALWATHEALNKGTNVFGNWLLTLRGGLDHRLANEPDVTDEQMRSAAKALQKQRKQRKDQSKPTQTEILERAEQDRRFRIRNRRILLALSWLSVESAATDGNRKDCKVVTTGNETKEVRSRALLAELWHILKNRQENCAELTDAEIGNPLKSVEDQQNTWIADCAASLAARIREDAVWVNRSESFDRIVHADSREMARSDARRITWWLLAVKDYLVLPSASLVEPANSPDDGSDDDSDVNTDSIRENTSDSGEGAGHRTRYPFGHLFGDSTGLSKLGDEPLLLRSFWGQHLRERIDMIHVALMPKEEARKKKPQNCTAPGELHRQMFSKAASRLAQSWTKQRQQEADRQARQAADQALRDMEGDPSYADVLEKIAEVFGESAIRPGRITGWDRVIQKWMALESADPEVREQLRINAVKVLQSDETVKKFGDVNLFIELAHEENRVAWFHNGRCTQEPLSRFVSGTKARQDSNRLKVAAYRHPDPHSNPIFCDFGNDAPSIEHGRLNPSLKPKDRSSVVLELWQPGDKKYAHKVTLLGTSRRFDEELPCPPDKDSSPTELPVVPRLCRISKAASGLPASATMKVAKVYDHAPVKRRKQRDDDAKSQEKPPLWNGKLSTDRRMLEAITRLRQRNHHKAADEVQRQLRWLLTVSIKLQPIGPWYDYIDKSLEKAPFQRTIREDKSADRPLGSKYVSYSGWPWEEIDKPVVLSADGKSFKPDSKRARGTDARLCLSRLPKLRVLSVDLGLRFAASCAVWETLSKQELLADIAKRIGCGPDEVALRIQQEQSKPIPRYRGDLDGLFLQIDFRVPDRKSDAKDKPRTAIYRRIGNDDLQDKRRHPAPWARLDRQFAIKLPGEERPARLATAEELWLAHRLETKMGVAVPIIDRLVRAGWGKSEKEIELKSALDRLGWKPLPVAQQSSDDPTAIAEMGPSIRVDELMSETVRTAGLSLRRHAELARVAFALSSAFKPMPGDRKYWFDTNAQGYEKQSDSGKDDSIEKRREKHIEYIQDALVAWYQLATSDKWIDEDARSWWNDHIAILVQTSGFNYVPSPNEAKKGKDQQREEKWDSIYQKLKKLAVPEKRRRKKEEEKTASARRAERDVIRNLLRPAAEQLRQDDSLRNELFELFKCRWLRDEGVRRQSVGDASRSDFKHDKRLDRNQRLTSVTTPKSSSGTSQGWYAILAELRNWLLPRGLQTRFQESAGEARDRIARIEAARNVGGLSLKRINTLVEFRKALIQFRTAGTPWGRFEIADGKRTSDPRELGPNYARHLLDVIGQLRQQRSKQLASRIVEAALGVGSENRKDHWDGRKRPNRLLENEDGRFKQCHAVVIEALDNYKPDETRGKRENKMLASWRKADFKKSLTEECHLDGLHLRTVMPNYTSRQDSRTGRPGIRCDEVSLDRFLNESRWRNRVADAREAGNKADSEQKMLLDLDNACQSSQKTGRENSNKRNENAVRDLLLPQKGGDIFVCVTGEKQKDVRSVQRIQADINAAANIGLRALLDPDFSGKWWYVPCTSKQGTPVKDKVKQSSYFDLARMPQLLNKESLKFATRDYMNAWRDPMCEANISYDGWLSATEYHHQVRARVIESLRALNGLKTSPA